MMKEKELVPKLRFSEFENKWESSSLREITSYVDYRGRAPLKSEKGYFLVTAKNIKKGFIDYDCSKEYVEKKHYSTVMSKGIPEIGDVLFTTEAPMGNVAQVNIANVALAQRVIKFRGNDNLRNSYLLFYMLSDVFQKTISKKAIGTTVQGISGKELHKINISFPNLVEQQKIANFLTSIDTQIQTLEKKKNLLAQYKKGVLQKIFKQEIRFKDDDGNDFSEWEFKNGNLLFKSISDKNHNSDLPILAVTQDQGAIPRHLIDYNIGVTAKSVSSYKVVQVGDFIISLRSFQGGIEYSNYKGICSPAYIILRPQEEMNRDFYKFYLKTPSYIQELTRKLEGIRDGKMISYKYFSEIKLPYPSLKEQTKIANFISAIDKNIDIVNTKIAHTKSHKKGLLQQMFV